MLTRSGLGALVTPEARHPEVTRMRPQRTTPNVVCIQCGVAFHVNPFRLGTAKFCNRKCHHAWRVENGALQGCFQPGLQPWNKGMRGIHLSPESEFKPGHRLNEEYEVGTVIPRCNGRHRRNYIKTALGWRYYAVWLWEQHYGPVMKGDVVHHLNGNRFDDRIENLIALPRKDHPIYHSRWGCKPIPADVIDQYVSRYQIQVAS